MTKRRKISDSYDVVIMGGGPAGATLAALLAKRTNLQIAIFDSEAFPREHIGESFAHPLIPVLEESGALPKVLASDCYVMKYGGIFNWDASGPSVAFFDHANFVADGVHRWAIHADRAEFDHILLNHARDLGVSVFDGVGVDAYRPNADRHVVTLSNGRQVSCRVFADASGRHNTITTGKRRAWLSSYKNVAIWNHYVGCRPTQTLDGEWNVFRAENRSPIGCFAFENGWCWYIPVPKLVDGKRTLTHSIGIVTTGAALKEGGKDYTEETVFFEQIRKVPLLRELVEGGRPLTSKMLTATNYSMMSASFSNYDEGWLLVGDAAYFVDPLFSSGVAFAAAQASAASLVIQHTLDGTSAERDRRDLWRDYDREWHGMAETYSLSIDQWYHAIARSNPGSIYWKTRGTSPDLEMHDQTFLHLLNTAFTPDLLQVITKGSRKLADLDPDGPYIKACGAASSLSPLDELALVRLAPGVALREGLGVDVPGFKAFIPPPPFQIPEEAKRGIAEYWRDPIAYSAAALSPHASPLRVHRFEWSADPDTAPVRSVEERDGGLGLYAILVKAPLPLHELRARLTDAQNRLLDKLLLAKMVVPHSGDQLAAGSAPTARRAPHSDRAPTA